MARGNVEAPLASRDAALALSAPVSDDEGSLVQLPGADGKLHWINMDGRFISELKVTENDVTFLLQNPSVPSTLVRGVDSSLGNFNPNRETKFIIHGFFSDGNSMREITDVFLQLSPVSLYHQCSSTTNVPLTVISVLPYVTSVLPSVTSVPPSVTSVLPSVTSVPLTVTSVPLSVTSVPLSPVFLQLSPVSLCHQCSSTTNVPLTVISVLPYLTSFIQAGADYNLIVVDWSGPANGLSAQAATVDIGTFTARLIEYLVTKGLTTANIDLIGFSLGAHVAAIAANRNTAGRIGRITGLDPVGRRYENVPLEDRLDISDGDFVQVIHTNGGFIGWGSDLGHVDFYPNDGNKQYGCGIDLTGACSHLRAVAFYAESTTSSVGFYGTRCGTWNDYNNGICSTNVKQIMGAHTPDSARGSFYLWTKNNKPYALGL
ncbi:unnamed protein product [Timema podura]|uniref:Lipase domain-containing protein n=1 Tax=Timema podura TaxID=61482 RepID=A0ABN7P4X5_TIMPD|nr:unnamed protein product [Timema podura]